MAWRRHCVALTVALSALGAAPSAQAINWLMFQGTAPEDGGGPPWAVWGFVQADYLVDQSDTNAAGGYVPAKLAAPDFTSQNAFNVSRARLGIRGRNLASDKNVNFFLLAEFGNNAITAAHGQGAALTDASITFNHIPHARLRAGLFKTPGAEEGLQGITTLDYVEFTAVTNFLVLERPPNAKYTANIPPTDPQESSVNLNGFTEPVAAFRDVGVQVFDAVLPIEGWELTYAAMVGNGNGLNMSDNNATKDVYGYLSLERVLSGGAFRDGIKTFLWLQQGRRNYDGDNDGLKEEYDRDRSGLGVSYRVKPWRATVEYMRAKGMIFLGPDKPSFDINGPASSGGSGLDGMGHGWYVDGGWRIPGTLWELDARYDVLTLLDDDPFEMEFKTLTLGVQYHFSPKTRLTFNASERDWSALHYGRGAGPNDNLDGIGRRYSMQITWML
jgi:hypothetical protein